MDDEILYKEGQVYKIGLHGKVFLEREGEWYSTNNLTVSQFNLALKKQNGKINATNN